VAKIGRALGQKQTALVWGVYAVALPTAQTRARSVPQVCAIERGDQGLSHAFTAFARAVRGLPAGPGLASKNQKNMGNDLSCCAAEHSAFSLDGEGLGSRRVLVSVGSAKIVADVSIGSLVEFRSSLVKQLDDAGVRIASADRTEEGIRRPLTDHTTPAVSIQYREFGTGEWLLLSSAALKDFALLQRSHRIEIAVSSSPHTKPTLTGNRIHRMHSAPPGLSSWASAKPSSEADGKLLWERMTAAADTLRSGQNQEECVTILAQKFEEAKSNEDFMVVHAIRWHLSDKVILAEILRMFCTKSQVVIQVCSAAGRGADVLPDIFAHLEHSSTLIELLSYKGCESQIHRGLRRENSQEIVESSFMEHAMQLGRLLMEKQQHALLCENRRFVTTIEHCLQSLRFLLTDGEAYDWSSKPARIRLMSVGFVAEFVRVLALDDESPTQDTFDLQLKEQYFTLLVELTKDYDNVAELRGTKVTQALVQTLGLENTKYNRVKKYAQLAVCQLVDEMVLEKLEDDIAEIAHMLTASVEKKIQGKFVFYGLQHILYHILKLSASNR
jgi:hypothetical protein